MSSFYHPLIYTSYTFPVNSPNINKTGFSRSNQYHVHQGTLQTSLRVCISHSSSPFQKLLSYFLFLSLTPSSVSAISFYLTLYVCTELSTWLWAPPGIAETSFGCFLHSLCTKQAQLLGVSGSWPMPFLLSTPLLIWRRLREGVAVWSFIQKQGMGWISCKTEYEPSGGRHMLTSAQTPAHVCPWKSHESVWGQWQADSFKECTQNMCYSKDLLRSPS